MAFPKSLIYIMVMTPIFNRRSFRAVLCSLYAFVVLGAFGSTATASGLRFFDLSQPGPLISNQLLEKFPFLLGYERPMNYLVLVQITDEIRPSGGFMSFIVFVRLESGQPTEVRSYGVESLEPDGMGAFDWRAARGRVLPPRPIERYMGLGNWVIRDANWWGDFRQSAAQVVNFWQRVSQDPIDGVIAVNDESIAALLDVIGGIHLPNGQVLFGEDFKAYAINNFYAGNRATWSSRQQQTADSLISAFASSASQIVASNTALLRVALAAYSQAANHNIMASVFDPEVAAMLNDLGFDGSLRTSGVSDYVFPVEANISYTKSSPFIDRDFAYSATLGADGLLTSQITITLHNGYSRDRRLAFPSFYYDGWRWNRETRQFYRSEGYYGAYERVYLPLSAHIVGATGFDGDADLMAYDPSPGLVVGGYVGLEAGEQQTIDIQWTQEQPYLVDGDTYRVYIQRQSGLNAHVTATVNYPDCEAGAGAPLLTRTWTNELSTDRTFDVTLADWSQCLGAAALG